MRPGGEPDVHLRRRVAGPPAVRGPRHMGRVRRLRPLRGLLDARLRRGRLDRVLRHLPQRPRLPFRRVRNADADVPVSVRHPPVRLRSRHRLLGSSLRSERRWLSRWSVLQRRRSVRHARHDVPLGVLRASVWRGPWALLRRSDLRLLPVGLDLYARAVRLPAAMRRTRVWYEPLRRDVRGVPARAGVFRGGSLHLHPVVCGSHVRIGRLRRHVRLDLRARVPVQQRGRV